MRGCRFACSGRATAITGRFLRFPFLFTGQLVIEAEFAFFDIGRCGSVWEKPGRIRTFDFLDARQARRWTVPGALGHHPQEKSPRHDDGCGDSQKGQMPQPSEWRRSSFAITSPFGPGLLCRVPSGAWRQLAWLAPGSCRSRFALEKPVYRLPVAPVR